MDTQNKVLPAHSKAKAALNKLDTSEKSFTVKTKGYEETFRNLTDAKSQYDTLKKRSVKSKEAIKLELQESDSDGHTKSLESVKIGKDFFVEE